MMLAQRWVYFLAWSLASLFYAYQYILRVMPNILHHDLLTQFAISEDMLGQISGIYYIGYAGMHLPLGILLDHYGPKKIMPLCILLTSVGLLPFIFAEHWLWPLLGRFLIGIGSSAAILGTFKVIRLCFREEHFTRMLSFAVTIGLLGAIYGGTPVKMLFAHFGPQSTLQGFIAVSIVLALFTYWAMPDMHSVPGKGIMRDIYAVLSNWRVVLVCLSAGLMVGPLEGFADAWSTPFLQRVYAYDAIRSSYLPSLIFVGMCFGAPVLSFIAEKTRSYYAVLIGSGLLMALVFALLIAQWLHYPSLVVGFTLVGVCSAYQILAIYKASTYVPEKLVGLTTAVANMIIMSFGYALHTVIGLLIKHMGGSQSVEAFQLGITVIPIALMLGVMGFMYLGFYSRRKLIT